MIMTTTNNISIRATAIIAAPAPSSGGATPAPVASDASLLPQPSEHTFIGGDIGAELAKLTIEMSREQRERAKSIRAAEERAQLAAENAQLSAMREKADNAFMAGMVSGYASFASGMANVAGGIQSGRGDAASAKALGGGAEAMMGVGKVAEAGLRKAADLDATYATEEEQRAGRAKRRADDARDDVQDAEKLVDKALTFFKEYQSAQQDTQKAALFRA
jgi:hypothetical protein